MPLALPTPVRRPARIALAVVGLIVAGCSPRDPLDRVVKAHSPAELKAWLSTVDAEVDPALAREIRQVFTYLATDTPRYRQPTTEFEMHRAGNPLCRRVNGRRLREVMIDGYSARIDTLSLQNNIDTENLVRLAAVANPERSEAFQRRADEVRAIITQRDQRIRGYRERIASLQAPPR